jgi:hypothetical protein
VDGKYSYTYLMKFGFEWMGWADNNWENPYNWSCSAVPDKYADVTIESGTVNVNSDVEVRSLYVKPGATLNIKPGKKLKVMQ